MIPPTRWQIVALIAAGFTMLAPLLPENAFTYVLTAPLSIGVLFGGAFFGGLHNDPPVIPVFAIATLVNALLWGGALRMTRWGRRRLGQSRDATFDIY